MSLNRLVSVLDQLDLYHQQMLDLGQAKKTSIINNDIDTLIRILNQESKLIKSIEQADEERIQASYSFLNERGIKSQLNLTVSELARLIFDIEEKQTLLDTQAHLKSTLDQLKQVNILNQQLLEQSLEFIEFSLDVMLDKPNQDITYQHPAAHQSYGTRQKGLFDRRG